jgi:hypothetical protein
MRERAYLIAERGRPKEVLEAWRTAWYEAELRLSELMTRFGTDGCFRFGFEKPVSFRFPGNRVPDGWTRPGPKGSSRPKKTNTADQSLIDELVWCEDLARTVQDAFNLPHGLSYEGPDGKGTRFLTAGGPNTFSACWTSGPGGIADVILITPDYESAARVEGEIRWLPEGSSPSTPDGFRRVTEAEVDLIFAQAKVDRERSLKTDEAPALSGP